LVNTLPAYEQYYRHRAMLWELQAISRNRPVAGDLKVGEQFSRWVAKLTDFSCPSLPLAGYRKAWRAEIARMRTRIERERTPAGKDAYAIKTGRGGLIDAEFVAQVLCLAQGWQEPNTVGALQRAKAEKILDPAEADLLVESYARLRRIEGILRRWSFVGETVLPTDAEPLYRVAVRCGFPDTQSFMKAVAGYRKKMRSVYQKVVAGE
jgi:glutamate-ammonia-ligase adenylyltransferase